MFDKILICYDITIVYMGKTDTNRRRFLYGAVASVTATLLAGCTGDDGDDGEDGTDDGTDGDETGDGTDGESTDDGTDGDDTDGGTEDGGDGSETPTQESETVLVGPDTQNVFEPSSLDISVGTEVTFVWESSGHSLLVDSQPDSADWGGVPETKSTDYEHTHVFEVAGTYDYYCEPHQTFGMEGTITVTEE
jgi:plastocyanin